MPGSQCTDKPLQEFCNVWPLGNARAFRRACMHPPDTAHCLDEWASIRVRVRASRPARQKSNDRPFDHNPCKLANAHSPPAFWTTGGKAFTGRCLLGNVEKHPWRANGVWLLLQRTLDNCKDALTSLLNGKGHSHAKLHSAIAAGRNKAPIHGTHLRT